MMVNKSEKVGNLDLYSGEYNPEKPTFYPSPPRLQADHTQNTLQKLINKVTCIISLWIGYQFEWETSVPHPPTMEH